MTTSRDVAGPPGGGDPVRVTIVGGAGKGTRAQPPAGAAGGLAGGRREPVDRADSRGTAMVTRRTFVFGGAAVAVAGVSPRPARAARPTVTVYKDPT